MSGEIPVLALLLDGPMQAWGASSRFGRRATQAYPTRSGITGLLCAAMGVPRADRDTLQELSALELELLVLEKKNRPMSRWSDYHTVGGGYEPATQAGFIPTTANDGKPRGTVLTEREYLADSAFGALLRGETGFLRRCGEALQNPRWGVWLGRKCCVPAEMVCQGVHASRAAAVAHLEGRVGAQTVRVIQEVERFEEGTDTVLDVPLDFSIQDPSQRNRPRRIRVDHVGDLPGGA